MVSDRKRHKPWGRVQDEMPIQTQMGRQHAGTAHRELWTLSHISNGRVKTNLRISQQSASVLPLAAASLSPGRRENIPGVSIPELMPFLPPWLSNRPYFDLSTGKLAMSFSPFLLAKSVNSSSSHTLPTAIKKQLGNSFYFI